MPIFLPNTFDTHVDTITQIAFPPSPVCWHSPERRGGLLRGQRRPGHPGERPLPLRACAGGRLRADRLSGPGGQGRAGEAAALGPVRGREPAGEKLHASLVKIGIFYSKKKMVGNAFLHASSEGKNIPFNMLLLSTLYLS